MLHGSCHCGAVRITIARRPRSLTECNCAICRRYGACWAYCTTRTAVIEARPGQLSTHASRTGTFLYHFCRHCGCVTHYRRVNTRDDTRQAINARMLEPEALESLPVRRLDVRS